MITEGALIRLALAGIALVVAAVLLSRLGSVLLPFLLAVVLAYVANPLITPLEARGVRRDRLVLAFFLSVVAVLVVAAQVVVPWVAELVAVQKARFPAYMTLFRHLPEQLERELVARLPVGGDSISRALEAGQEHLVTWLQSMPKTMVGMAPLLLDLAIVPFVMYFLLVQGPDLIEGFVRACPSRHMEKALSLVCQIDEVLGNYLRGLFTISLAVGFATWLGLTILGVHYALEISVLTAVTNLVPYLGPVVGGAAGAAVAYFQFHTTDAVVRVLALVAVVRFLDDWVFQPVIMQSAVELHPVLIAFALMAGGHLFGFLGLLFAVPVVCILKEAGRVVYDWYIAESGLKQTHLSRHALRLPYL